MGYKDHPDGEQCFHKVLEVSKYSGFIGLMVSTYDVMMISRTQGYLPTILQYMKYTIPCLAAGGTFAAVTCVSTNLRGKDDKINYFIGGASAGGVFGMAARTFRVGIPVGVALGMLACLFKDSKDSGWEFFPQAHHRMSSIDWRGHDYTLTKDRR